MVDTSKRFETPYQQGMLLCAEHGGNPFQRKSPYPPGSQEDTDWLKGWDDCRKEKPSSGPDVKL